MKLFDAPLSKISRAVTPVDLSLLAKGEDVGVPAGVGVVGVPGPGATAPPGGSAASSELEHDVDVANLDEVAAT